MEMETATAIPPICEGDNDAWGVETFRITLQFIEGGTLYLGRAEAWKCDGDDFHHGAATDAAAAAFEIEFTGGPGWAASYTPKTELIGKAAEAAAKAAGCAVAELPALLAAYSFDTDKDEHWMVRSVRRSKAVRAAMVGGRVLTGIHPAAAIAEVL